MVDWVSAGAKKRGQGAGELRSQVCAYRNDCPDTNQMERLRDVPLKTLRRSFGGPGMACLGSVWGMMSFSLSPKLIAPVYVECDCPCARLRILGTLSN